MADGNGKSRAEIERMPPFDAESEASLLCAWVLGEDARLVKRTRCEPEDFYLGLHRRIATSVLSLVDTGAPVDGVLVWSRFKETWGDDAKDFEDYSKILLRNVAPPNAFEYVKPVKSTAASRRLLGAASELLSAAYDPTSDEGALRERVESVNLALCDTAPTELSGAVSDHLPGALADLRSARGDDDPKILSWGISELDRVGLYIAPGDFPVLAARPGCGKSTFARGLAIKTAARTGRKVIYLSLEEAPTRLVRAAILAESSVMDPARRGVTPEQDARLSSAADWLSKVPCYFPARFPTVLGPLCAWLYGVCGRHQPALVVIDYMGLVIAPGKSAYEKMTEISKRLRGVARETDVPILAVQQLNRVSAGEHREPELTDLRDSGQVEQDATAVVMLHYPYAVATKEQRAKGEAKEGDVTLLVKKSRESRNFVRVPMRLEGAYKRMLAAEAGA